MSRCITAAMGTILLGAAACPGPEPSTIDTSATAASSGDPSSTASGSGGAPGEGGASTAIATSTSIGTVASAGGSSPSSSTSSAGGGGGATTGGGGGAGPSECELNGFSFSPDVQPQAPDFTMLYADSTGWTCVEFAIECTGLGEMAVGGPDCFPAPCWQADISGCDPGPATVRFFRDWPTGEEGSFCQTEHGDAPEGVLVSMCSFEVLAP